MKAIYTELYKAEFDYAPHSDDKVVRFTKHGNDWTGTDNVELYSLRDVAHHMEERDHQFSKDEVKKVLDRAVDWLFNG